jgi:hypothetical protein
LENWRYGEVFVSSGMGAQGSFNYDRAVVMKKMGRSKNYLGN